MKLDLFLFLNFLVLLRLFPKWFQEISSHIACTYYFSQSHFSGQDTQFASFSKHLFPNVYLHWLDFCNKPAINSANKLEINSCNAFWLITVFLPVRRSLFRVVAPVLAAQVVVVCDAHLQWHRRFPTSMNYLTGSLKTILLNSFRHPG